jgi:uncharacterized protein YdeI (BOF family)
MDTTEFWKLIEQSRYNSNGDVDKQAEILVNILTTLSLEEILDYQRIFDELEAAAQQYDLIEIADVIYGGIGDSGWKDFTAWLIGQGKTVYENAIDDPESLVDVVSLENREKIRAEALVYVAHNTAENKTEGNYDFSSTSSDKELSMGENLWKGATVEEHDRRVKEKFPRAWAKFGW